MVYLVIALIALGVFAAMTALFSRHDDGDANPYQEVPTCATCNGDNDKCEQECMMEAATKDIVYYDDEELDAFRGRTSDAYSDDEAEQFREVLYTMQPHEVKEWNRSLILRGIGMPDQIKDEVIMIIEGQ